jgi:hypothetical protein
LRRRGDRGLGSWTSCYSLNNTGPVVDNLYKKVASSVTSLNWNIVFRPESSVHVASCIRMLVIFDLYNLELQLLKPVYGEFSVAFSLHSKHNSDKTEFSIVHKEFLSAN